MVRVDGVGDASGEFEILGMLAWQRASDFKARSGAQASYIFASAGKICVV